MSKVLEVEFIGVKPGTGTMIKQEDGAILEPTPGVDVAASAPAAIQRDDDVEEEEDADGDVLRLTDRVLSAFAGEDYDKEDATGLFDSRGMAEITADLGVVNTKVRDCFKVDNTVPITSDLARKMHPVLDKRHMRSSTESNLKTYCANHVAYIKMGLRPEFRQALAEDAVQFELSHKSAQYSAITDKKRDALEAHLDVVADELDAGFGLDCKAIAKILKVNIVHPVEKTMRRVASGKLDKFAERLRAEMFGMDGSVGSSSGGGAADSSSGGEE